MKLVTFRKLTFIEPFVGGLSIDAGEELGSLSEEEPAGVPAILFGVEVFILGEEADFRLESFDLLAILQGGKGEVSLLVCSVSEISLLLILFTSVSPSETMSLFEEHFAASSSSLVSSK